MNANGAPEGAAATNSPAVKDTRRRGQPTAEAILTQPHGLLTRGHLAELGLGRRAIDAVFTTLNVVVFPGSKRPMIRAADYLELVDASTYDGSRVR